MKLLFICTHNRCRSILAEAITNHYGHDVLIAKSAGSQPAGEVHPLSIQYLAEAGINIDGLCSQSWDEHEEWQPDVVITVCDSAAGESCPIWFGKAIKVHWGLSDPSSQKGSDADIAKSFRHTIQLLISRIEQLITLDVHKKEKEQVITIFNTVGKS